MELQRDFYVGVVEDNKDPNRKGRIKVRVQTLYHNLSVEDIPYAHPFAGLAGKEFQVPAVGKLVNVLFLSDDLYSPYYIFSENYNTNLKNKLKDLSEEEYVNFVALLFDERTNIFADSKELTIDHLINKITINNTSINHELKDNEQILNLGSKQSSQDAVLGTRFFEWMDKFMNELANPFSLIGNYGAPILRPKINKLIIEYKLLRPDFVSNNVKIVDNGKVKKLKRKPDTISNKDDMDLILNMEDETKLCQEQLKNELNSQKELEKLIKEQDMDSCKNIKKSKPSNNVPLQPNYIVDKWTYNNKLSDKDNQDISSKIDKLHPNMKPYAISFINKCLANNIKLKIVDGFRSFAEQQSYVDRGLPAAKPGYSYHNYGLALDVEPTNSSDWTTIGKIGESLGFRWGKYFKNPKSEPWHFDWGNIAPSTQELKNRYENGYLIAGYVRIEEDSNVTPTNNFNGQDYVLNKDCSTEETNKIISDETEQGDIDPITDPTKEDDKLANCTETKYPNLPIISKPPPTELTFKDAIKYLNQKYNSSIAKSVFAVMYAEASKNSSKTAFVSPGGYNYSGVQTDSGVWEFSNFNAQYATNDAERCRMFASFKNNYDFLDFMANRLEAKGFGDEDGENYWTERYLNSWVFLDLKNKNPNKYNSMFASKSAIYKSAIKKYDNLA